jgi:hypothetical protein
MKIENIDYILSESSTSLSKISDKETRYFTPIGRDLRLVEEKTTQRFWILKQPNKGS